MKKLLYFFLAFVFLIFVAVLVLPFVIDVDKYRPEITQAVNEKINGKFELGKLSLSLWGQVRVEVAGVHLSDSKNNEIISVKDAYFHLPFSSFLSGAPTLTFKMQSPEIKVIKDRSGKMNILSLIKISSLPPPVISPPTATSPTVNAPTLPPTSAAPEKKVTENLPAGGTLVLPGLVAQTRLGVEVLDASFIYKDETLSKEPQKISHLNLLIKDISLTRSTELELWAEIESHIQSSADPALSVHGPFKIKAKATPEISQGKFQKVDLHLDASFDDIEISKPGLFLKKKGVSSSAEGDLQASLEKVTIQHLLVKFFNAEIKTSGTLNSVGMFVNLNMKSNDIAFKPWSELIPMLKNYELSGSVTFDADVNGPADKLNYESQIKFKNITAKAPHLKSQPVMDASVKVMTNQIENFLFTLRAPGNDLKIQGKLVSFEKPQVQMDITSSGMDLDQLIEFPKTGKGESSKNSNGGMSVAYAADEGNAGGSQKGPDYDAMLSLLRENKMARASTARVGLGLKSLKAYDVKMTDLSAKMSFVELAGTIDSFSMGLWNGVVKSNIGIDLKPAHPSYQFGAEVVGLDLKQATTSQFPLFKNTIIGKAFYKMTGTGASLNSDLAISNLNAKGNMKVEKATFATIDVGKMAAEAVTKSIQKIGEKYPQLKDKKINAGGGRESRYDLVTSDFTISGGKFSAPNFSAKAEPNQGIDVKGDTTVGMKDYSLKALWEVIDTYNFTKSKDLTVDQAGIRVEHILAEGDGPVRFPVHVNCTIKSPCYSYTEVPEFLAKIALANVSKAVEGKAKAELKKKAEEKLQDLAKKAPPATQEKLKSLSKKFFGH